jgi:uncharacterized Zn finger protein
MDVKNRVPEAARIDPCRLERSLQLRAERLGGRRYRVAGGRDAHWVDLADRAVPLCDCGDHLWRDAVCKHILAALLREGDPRVLAALGLLVRRLRAAAAPALASSV